MPKRVLERASVDPGVRGPGDSVDKGEAVDLHTAMSVARISFEPAALEAYARGIFEPGGPRAIRVRERDGGRSVVLVAKLEDATRVLMDERCFSLTHYELQFAAVAPKGVRMLLAPQTPEQKRQKGVFIAAAQRMANTALADAVASREKSTHSRRAIARNAVESLLSRLRARERPEFDIIGEYAYFAPYLVAREMFGLPGPSRRFLLIRLLAAARRLWGSFHRFTPETTPFLTAVYLAQLAFAQIFANFDNRSWLVRWVARYGAARFEGHIRDRFDLAVNPEGDPYPNSLLSCLCQGAGDVSDDGRERYRDQAVSLLLEMFGTALLIPPSGFTGIVEWMVKQPGGIPAQLEGLSEANMREFVDEALRLAPPSKYLLRTASEGVTLGDFHIEKGEYVCALVAQACRDPEAFPEPGTFRLDRSAKSHSLHVGPANGPHQCIGRELARDMLGEMLLGLKAFPNLRPVRGLEIQEVLMFPQLMVGWNREAGDDEN